MMSCRLKSQAVWSAATCPFQPLGRTSESVPSETQAPNRLCCEGSSENTGSDLSRAGAEGGEAPCKGTAHLPTAARTDCNWHQAHSREAARTGAHPCQQLQAEPGWQRHQRHQGKQKPFRAPLSLLP